MKWGHFNNSLSRWPKPHNLTCPDLDYTVHDSCNLEKSSFVSATTIGVLFCLPNSFHWWSQFWYTFDLSSQVLMLTLRVLNHFIQQVEQDSSFNLLKPNLMPSLARFSLVTRLCSMVVFLLSLTQMSNVS